MAITKKTVDKKRSNIKRKGLVLIFLFLLVFFILINGYIFLQYTELKKGVETKINEVKLKEYQPMGQGSVVHIKLPAVNNEGRGVTTLLTVEAIPGSGRALVDIGDLLFWADTQNSIRTAKNVAAEVTNIDPDSYDLFYDIRANASIIAGPSAGAALAVATVSAIEGKSLRDDVMITGTINHDGTIGPVGEITSKAKAAKEGNANIFLVPLLQSKETTYETTKHCEKYGFSEFCTIEQIPKQVNVADESGIEIIEVGSIKEALKYFY